MVLETIINRPTTPLLLLTHFRGVIDKYDSLLVNTLAQHRRVILADYAGVGLITGAVASSVRQSAADMLAFLSLIGEREVDVLGFSFGGTVAQLMALNADPAGKAKVRKLILAGTSSSMGEGVRRSPNTDVFEVAAAKEVTIETFKRLFFLGNAEGTAAAEQWWARIHERSAATGCEEGSFERLKGLDIPVLVMNGHDDYMTPTVNSWVIQQRLPNAELLIYPNSGHGAIFQYASYFAPHALAFLSS
ncbi:alpha/beta-hydrolase [Parathielavia hyrcaniae]|uniref:Alpha/beta-hydrolase n=1 Tax=Parathielavia hyrcaniae TaxID=113614 RepID=A0AAN6SXG0_9PEZI|nr:alpha/beta-hydrolase [Parathielavia hyrcaniae]